VWNDHECGGEGVRRFGFNVAAAVSPLLCVWLAAAWLRSYYSHGRVGWSAPNGRYTLHSDQGHITLTGPPVPISASAEAEAQAIVSRINNHYLAWNVERRSRYSADASYHLNQLLQEKLFKVRGGKLRRSLLRALDDPDRVVAAHLALMQTERIPFWGSHELQDDGSFRYEVDGLRLTLLPGPWDYAPYLGESQPYRRTCNDPQFWRIDSAQLPAIRNRWHDRLDRRIASFSMAWLLAAALVPPLLWLAYSLRRGNRLGQHACTTCGYDVRATPEDQSRYPLNYAPRF
jgi:hypothetical protein